MKLLRLLLRSPQRLLTGKRMTLGYQVLLVLLYLHTQSRASEPVGYICSGIQQTRNVLHPSQAWNFTNQFKIVVAKDGRWLLELNDQFDRWPERVKQGFVVPKGLETTTVMSYDGTDTFYVRNVALPEGQRYLNKTNYNNYIPYSFYISSGNYPMFYGWNDDGRGVIWLAFVGGEYLKSLKKPEMPLPWRNPRRSLSAYGFRFDADMDSEAPHVLNGATFIRDYSLDLPEEEEFSRPELDQPDKKKRTKLMKDLELRSLFYANGATQSVYKLVSYTNLGGWKIPMQFTLERLYPKSTNRDESVLHTIMVTNVSLLDALPSFQPPRNFASVAMDSRLRYRDERRNVDTVNYMLPPGLTWPKTNSPDIQKQFNVLMEFSERTHFASNRTKRLLFFLLLLILVGALPFLLTRQKGSRGIPAKA